MMKVVLVTGGFDPLHSGHISYLKAAKELGDFLIVGLNSDQWLIRKKSRFFMSWEERASVLREMSCVDEVLAFDDSNGSAVDAIHICLKRHGSLIFANGGDRLNTNIPEMTTFQNDVRIDFRFGVGGFDKLNSSSQILSDWKSEKVDREWGYYKVLHNDGIQTKVKELVVKPHSSLSTQRHRGRNERWIVTSGKATVRIGESLESFKKVDLSLHDEIVVPVMWYHQLINNTDTDLKIVEIQYGRFCIEEDIERYNTPG